MAVNEGAHQNSGARGRGGQSNLPDWLRDVEVDVEPDEDDVSWATDVDFSSLPGWLAPESLDETDEYGIPDWLEEPTVDEDDVEREGTGLLAGVPGPIPIEPIIVLSHQAPPFPGRAPARDSIPVAPNTSPMPVRTAVQPAEGGGGSRVRTILLVVLVVLLVLAIAAMLAVPDLLDLLQLIPGIGMHLYG